MRGFDFRNVRGEYRGNYRGGSRGGPRGGYVSSATRHVTDREPLEGLGSSPLQIISIPSVDDVSEKKVVINDVEYLGSYNWVKSKATPTIIVPGSPPEYRTRRTPFSVSPDTGMTTVDQNGHRMLKAVLQPLLQAVDVHRQDTSEPDFDWSGADFITDRNNLRKLLRWIDANGREEVKEFRIDMQLAGLRTILFNRWEKRYEESMSGYTFGYHFEEATTQPEKDCEDSSSHHRIITYNLNGFTMVVRYEVDAYIPTAPSGAPTTPRTSSGNVEDLIGSLAGLGIKTEQASLPVLSTSNGLTILKGGVERPQSSIAELATLSERRITELNWGDRYPQLYLSQTPNHILGLHNRGIFSAIQQRKLDESTDLKVHANKVQHSMQKLRDVLETIQDIVVAHGKEGRLSLVCDGKQLKVYERESDESCLSDVFLERFD